jgi:4-hydroxybenzoate polyprenyltransferase
MPEVITSHPGPSLAISGLTTLLAAEAAPHGVGPILTAPALLAGKLSVGWSNDACNAGRDTAAVRTDKPVARGAISPAAVWTAAGIAVAAGLALALAIGPVTGGLYAWPSRLGGPATLASNRRWRRG